MSNKDKDKDSTRRVRTVKKRKKASTKKKELDKTRIMSLIDEDDEPKKVTVNRKKNISSRDVKDTKRGKRKVVKKDKTRTRSGKKKFKYRHPRIATIIRIILIVLILLTIIGIAIAIGSVYGFFGDELKISKEDLVLKYENSIVYDLDGNEIATLSSGTKRKSVSMSEMSPYLPKAYVAIEDERFYSHGGVDVLRTGRATVNYILHAGKSKFGGSTITQQLVKNITEDKEKTSSRKIKEMAKAIQVERLLTKDQILELYLNTIFIGGNDVNGVALGAIYYFNKDVKDLTLAQCAFLAGINSQPNYYNPFADRNKDENGNPSIPALQQAQAKTRVVLGKMLELGFITREEYDNAMDETNTGLLCFNHGDGASSTVEISYHTEAAIDQVINQLMEEKGMTKDMAEVYVLSGGLRIYTTQNSHLQNIVENTLINKAYVITTMSGSKDGNPQQAMTSFTIIDHAKGQVVACGAGTKEELKKTKLGYFNIPTELKKQTGSSMKPLAVIAPGLESGRLTAATTFIDAPTNFGGYQPKNYYAGYRGSMTMRYAIQISANIPNVKGLSYTGLDYSKEFLGKIGIDNLANEGLGLALGGLENGVSTLQMAEAYSMIANGGLYIEPTFYTRVTDKDGNTILEPHQESYQMMSPQNAYIEKDILRSVVTSGTATYCAIRGMDVAAKTGTTNGDYDRWLCGFTAYYTAACWYGYEYSAEVYASGNPAGKIWANVMTQVHNGLPGAGFVRPEGVVAAQICTITGHIAGPSCTSRGTELFVEGHLPSACSGHSGGAVICKDSGLLANQYCPNKSTLYSGMSPEEKEGNWSTSGYSNGKAPTATCTIHKAPAPTPPPTPTPTPTPTPEKKDTTTTKPSTDTTTKPSTDTTKPSTNTTKPSTDTTKPQSKTP